MLDNLDQQPPDALLALIKLHDADPRADKIDLGVGVYRTGQGETPVFGAIKAAEQKLVDEQDSKAYLGPEGDMGFVHALMPYVFGGDDPTRGGRIEGMQTPGGTGAVRLALALAKKAGVTRVLMGMPSWPNHAQIVADLGLELVSLPARHGRRRGRPRRAQGRAGRRRRGRRGAAARLLPQPDRHRLYARAVGRDRRAARGRARCCRSSTSPTRASAQGMEEDAYGARAVIAAVPEALVAYSLRQELRPLPRPRRRALRLCAGRRAARPRAVERPRAGARRLVDAARSRRRRGAAGARGRSADRAVARRARPDARPHPPGARRARRGGHAPARST